MDELKEYFAKLISNLVSSYEVIELRGCIDEKSYALEFFVTSNGKRQQCYEMVDAGELLETQVDGLLQSIAQYARSLPGYVHGTLNAVNIKIVSV